MTKPKLNVETDETEGRQFIKDATIGECVREIQALFKQWELRPLERELVLKVLLKEEAKMQQMKMSREVMGGSLGMVNKMFGGKK